MATDAARTELLPPELAQVPERRARPRPVPLPAGPPPRRLPGGPAPPDRQRVGLRVPPHVPPVRAGRDGGRGGRVRGRRELDRPARHRADRGAGGGRAGPPAPRGARARGRAAAPP